MDILKKEFVKYARPMFFNVGRVLVYIVVVLLVLGVYSSTDVSEPNFIHFWLMSGIALLGIIYDVINGIKKAKTYLTHKVKLTEDYILFVDHHGRFKLPYEDIQSFQLLSNQILIRTKWNRFVISGKLHGIEYEELKEMMNHITGKNIVSRSSNTFIYFLVAFIAVNYGAQYLFVDILNLPAESSVFYVFYLVFFIVAGVIGFERYQLSRLKVKEEK